MSELSPAPNNAELITLERRRQPQPADEGAPFPDSGAQPAHEEASPLAVGGRSPKWQEIIWREWCTSEDEEYAQHLFNLVSNTALGWGSALTVALSGTLYGLLAGYLVGLIALNRGVESGPWLLTGTLPLTLAWLFGVIGGVSGTWLSQRLSWRVWLGLITPNVFANKVMGGIGRASPGLFIGFIGGLFGLEPFISAMLGGLSGLPSGSRRIVSASVLAGLIGSMISGLTGPAPWLGLGLSLVTGVWLGLAWGSGPLGLMISWLGMLLGLAIFGSGNWLVSWLGVAVGFGLGILPNMLGHGLDDEEAYQYRSWYVWWREQPSVTKVERALQLMGQASAKAGEGWADLLDQLKQQKEQPGQPGPLLEALQSSHWAERLVARHGLVALGGEAITPLRRIAGNASNPLQSTAIWLLTQIEQETTNRLGWRSGELLCPDCLARFTAHSINLSWVVSFSYYGCRLCGQSRKFWQWLTVVAVLDTSWDESYQQQNDQLRLNWLTRRTLFDFDQVEIIQASDEEVERFAVQVGNDTDPFRQPRYAQLPCRIVPNCHLSENTLRILQRTFGQVIIDAPHL